MGADAEAQMAEINYNELREVAADAKAYAQARETKRLKVEDKVYRLLDQLRDLSKELLADLKDGEEATGRIQTYLSIAQDKAEGMAESPERDALDNVIFYGRMLVDCSNDHNDTLRTEIDAAVREIDETASGQWGRDRAKREDRLADALMGLPSAE